MTDEKRGDAADAQALTRVHGPGGSGDDPYFVLANAVDAALGALGAAAEMVPRVEGQARDRALAVLEIKFGELGDFAHDLRRVIAAVRREERDRR